MFVRNVLCFAIVLSVCPAALGDVFTWQGKLVDAGFEANGVYDFKFRLYDAAAGPSQVGVENVVDDVSIVDGLVTVDLDFSAGTFPGADRWLEIDVKADAAGAYDTLAPRQPIHPTPYAHHAFSAATAVSVPDGGLPASYRAPIDFTSNENEYSGSLVNIAPPAAAVGQTLIQATSPAASNFGSIDVAVFRANPASYTGTVMRIDGRRGDSTAYDLLHIRNNLIGTAQTKFIIQGNGKVGIGTDSPSHSLTIESDGDQALRLIGPGAFGSEARLTFGDADLVSLHEDVDDSLSINTPYSTSRIALMTAKAGIGTLTPTERLQLGDFSSGDEFVKIATAGGNLYRAGIKLQHFEDDNGFSIVSDEQGAGPNGFHIIDDNVSIPGDAATQLFIANDTGLVGIGTTSPTNRLSVSGNADVSGTLSKGGGAFRIDHPQDPENKELWHSFVESPDMMNIYNGTAVLDEFGTAVVEMPGYFESLNRDFQYQLTPIGAPMRDLYIASEMNGNTFEIAGGKPGMKVSWMVTGIRQDPFAEANRIPNEIDKRPEDRGKYLHPEAYGLPLEMGADYAKSLDGATEREQAVLEEQQQQDSFD